MANYARQSALDRIIGVADVGTGTLRGPVTNPWSTSRAAIAVVSTLAASPALVTLTIQG